MTWYENISQGNFSKDALLEALKLSGEEQEKLFSLARARRSASWPQGQVETRSVVELSNVCHQGCLYCAIGCLPKDKYFTIGTDRFLDILDFLHKRGRKNILLQSGENDSRTWIEHVGTLLNAGSRRYPDLNFILNIGNLSLAQARMLREAGAKRCIIKFETSNSVLFKHLKPRDDLKHRLEAIGILAEAGFLVGSGNMVGLPGQEIEDLVNDLLLLNSLPLYMGSTTAFIPGVGSKLADSEAGDLDMTLNYMALMRIMNPHLQIPTTSSLEKAGGEGQFRGLMAGANTVTIHDGTPEDYRAVYPIYSADRFTPQEEYIKKIVRRADLEME